MATYKCLTTGQFRRDVKLCIKQGRNMDLLGAVISLLSDDGRLPQEYLRTNSPAGSVAFGNAISSRIGYYFGRKTIKNSS